MDNIKNRRKFLRDIALGTASISAMGLLSSCSSFDDYLFEDRYDFNDEVMIIGGGISGLYLAHKLRFNKTEFRLFEGSNFFGGRIRSNGGADYGASLISVNDKNLKLLLQDLSLEAKALDKEYLFLPSGMQSVTDALVERIIGLIPYRNFRMRWRLMQIRKYRGGFELLFEHPQGQKRFNCKKVALAIPPTQWPSVVGLLELPEMQWAAGWLETLAVENSIKIVLPGNAVPNLTKPRVELNAEDAYIRQIVKKGKLTPSVEIEVSYPQTEYKSVEAVYGLIKKKLQIEYPFEKLAVEQYFDWRQVKLIRGSKFRNFMAVPESTNKYFQIVGDFTPSRAIYTIEGALESATRASELLL